jgi:predicted MFS family arabinose efflux permease
MGLPGMLGAEPRATEAASSLYVSVFNASIALDSFSAGLVVDALGPHG